jgi:hypothetical protein
VNLPSSEDTEPHCGATHHDAITIPWKVGEIMFWCATAKAHEIVGVATNDPETARCYKEG